MYFQSAINNWDWYEESLRATINSIADAVIATDIHGRITRMNPIAEKLTGWKFDEAEGKSVNEIAIIIDAITHNKKEFEIEEILLEKRTIGLRRNSIMIARNGDEYLISDSYAPIQDDTGKPIGVVLVFRDITKEYSLREQLSHRNKMDSIGLLAGGVAHDFNNMLGCIISAADLLKSPKRKIDEQGLKYVDIINRSAKQAADLTTKLLAYGRKAKISSIPIDIHNVIENTVAILGRTIDKNISISITKSDKKHIPESVRFRA